MKRPPANLVVFIIFALLIIAILREVHAQEKSPGLRIGQCLPIATAVEIVKDRFREVIVFRATNHLEETVLITQNPLTKSWTALQTHLNGYMCVAAYGKDGHVIQFLEDDRDSKPK